MSQTAAFLRNVGPMTALGIGAVLTVGLYGGQLLLRSRRKKKLTMVIETISCLKQKHVHMKDKSKVEATVCQLIEGGRDKLQVITDFDHTLTRFHENGKRLASSYGVLDNAKILPQLFSQRANALFEKYYPIEIDSNLSTEEKIPFMQEWYRSCHELIVSCKIRRDDIDQMVEDSDALLRSGADWFLESLNLASVPLLIFSAGIGDLLESIIRHQSVFYPNIQVVSNYMDFDGDGVVSGFKGETIHTFNKNESAIRSSTYFEKLKMRSNVILLGDMLGDLQMSEGVSSLNGILKIGFLNDKINENLPLFLDNYDIVLTDDQTLDVVNAILEKIL